ncbi:MAG: hypothetical protein AAF641_12545 [Pseudomonadota bacterium]
MAFDFGTFGATGWEYRKSFTIDPSRGAEAWEKLTQNQWGLEIGMLPITLHYALLETLSYSRLPKEMSEDKLEHR